MNPAKSRALTGFRDIYIVHLFKKISAGGGTLVLTSIARASVASAEAMVRSGLAGRGDFLRFAIAKKVMLIKDSIPESVLPWLSSGAKQFGLYASPGRAAGTMQRDKP